MVENSQGFKTYESILKAQMENYFKTSYYLLKDFFEKTKYQILFSFLLIQTYASLLAKE
jgi:hypothetical protein